MKVLGLGNALVDVLTQLKTDELINEFGLVKGGMEMIDEVLLKRIVNSFEQLDTAITGGGSASNAITGMARLGMETGFLGKVCGDEHGRFYAQDLKKSGVSSHLILTDQLATGCAMTFITPGGERTFGTYLGAAASMTASELNIDLFKGYDLLHVEGYLFFNPDLIRRAMELAKEAGLKISLDMASYNVVKIQHAFFEELITNYADILFANEDEALAFNGLEPEESALKLSELCEIAVVKCGAKGSIIACKGQITHIAAHEVECVDTTGAGDLYASGFIYGLSQGLSLAHCGEIGTVTAEEVIQHIGPRIPDHGWAKIKQRVSQWVI